VDSYRRADVAVTLSGRTDDSGLPPLLELCCYRIIEEALTNVTRHSSASAATVEVDRRDRRIRLAVADPGPAGPERTDGGGRGLIGMRERVTLFGGTLSAGPSPGGGFAVVVELPVAPTSPPASH